MNGSSSIHNDTFNVFCMSKCLSTARGINEITIGECMKKNSEYISNEIQVIRKVSRLIHAVRKVSGLIHAVIKVSGLIQVEESV